MAFDTTFGEQFVAGSCDGTGFWQVDLGGVYDLHRVVVFNRLSLVGSVATTTFTGWMAGATIQFLNFFGDQIGLQTLNATAAQHVLPIIQSPTPSQTASGTGTSSTSPSRTDTSSPSASISFGASPSQTPTASVTPSITPSSTPTQTPSATQQFAPSWLIAATGGVGPVFSAMSGTTEYRVALWNSSVNAARQCNGALCSAFGVSVNALGGWRGWDSNAIAADFTCPSGSRYFRKVLIGGTPCAFGGGVQPRNSTFTFSCGNPGMAAPIMTYLNEGGTCVVSNE